MSIAELLNYNQWTNLNVNSIKAKNSNSTNMTKACSSVFYVNHGLFQAISATNLLSCSAIILGTGGVVTESTSVVIPSSALISALFTPLQLYDPSTFLALSFSVDVVIQAALGPRNIAFPADILNTAISNDPAFWTNTTLIPTTNGSNRTLIFTYIPSRSDWSCFTA